MRKQATLTSNRLVLLAFCSFIFCLNHGSLSADSTFFPEDMEDSDEEIAHRVADNSDAIKEWAELLPSKEESKNESEELARSTDEKGTEANEANLSSSEKLEKYKVTKPEPVTASAPVSTDPTPVAASTSEKETEANEVNLSSSEKLEKYKVKKPEPAVESAQADVDPTPIADATPTPEPMADVAPTPTAPTPIADATPTPELMADVAPTPAAPKPVAIVTPTPPMPTAPKLPINTTPMPTAPKPVIDTTPTPTAPMTEAIPTPTAPPPVAAVTTPKPAVATTTAPPSSKELQPLQLTTVEPHSKPLPVKDQAGEQNTAKRTVLSYSDVSNDRAPLGIIESTQEVQNQKWYIYSSAIRGLRNPSDKLQVVSMEGSPPNKADEIKDLLVDMGIEAGKIQLIDGTGDDHQKGMTYLFAGR